jgi:hypothetical protein
MISYTIEIKTDRERLNAVYSLLEQMRLEHNKQGLTAKSNWRVYQDKWAEYTKIFRQKQSSLLLEQCRLKDAIRKASYTDDYWYKLTDQEREALELELFGDKQLLKLLPTLAQTDSLDNLKLVRLDELNGEFVDPVEDFSTYAETDPQTVVTVTATKVSWVGLDKDGTTRVLYDKGAAHFGNFQHLVTISASAAIYSGDVLAQWAVCNSSTATTATYPILYIQITYNTTSWRIYLVERDDANNAQSDLTAAINYGTSTVKYFTIARSGTDFTCAIYNDASRTSLFDTLVIANVTETTMRYVYALAPQAGTRDTDFTGYTENLDLQEAGGETYEVSCTDGIKAGEPLVKGQMEIGVAVTDGLAGADAAARAYTARPAASDGLKLSEVLVTLLEAQTSITEGVKLSDSGPIMYEHYNVGYDTYASISSVSWKAQSFTPSVAHKISSVKLLIHRIGLPGTLTVSIRAVDLDGKPTGADLCSGTTNGDTLPLVGDEWREIEFSSPYALSSSTQYAIVCRAPGAPAFTYVLWALVYTSPSYSGGSYFTSNNSGGSWIIQNYDVMFEEYGVISPVAQLTTSPSLLDGFKLSESLMAGLFYAAVAADVLKGTDTPSITYAANPSISDGLKLAEVLATLLTSNPAVLDGFKTSDSPVTQAVMNAVSSDGLKVSDTALAGLLYAALAEDGVKGGDAGSIYLSITRAITEGIRMGESLSNILTANPAVVEGIKAGDSAAIQRITGLLARDGLKVSDAVLLGMIYYLAATDGLTIADSNLLELIKKIALTLLSRSLSFTLRTRSTSLTLDTRTTSFTLPVRD